MHARDTAIAPISFNPAQNWEGIDGSWNTFNIRVGTPTQTVRVQISTASQQTWVVAPRGCEQINLTNCADDRGGIFYYNQSSTWKDNGLFYLGLEENLNLGGDAEYGYDVVSLMGDGEGGPTLENTTVGAFGAEDFWFGHFGVNPKPTNFTSFNDPSPSYMSLLSQNGLIPSLSFGYTAGASYRFTKVLASLTLGGYDSSRFVSNDLVFQFAPDNERDLVVAIQLITASAEGQSSSSLLPSPVYAYIDSTVPQIWLPADACHKFEDAFGLTYDSSTDLYLVNSAQHAALVKLNPNVTLTISAGLEGGATVDIVLPYAAFDMQATPPYQGLIQQSRYFPLRRAANATQYTLGRTFLQEAYLAVDWERETFTVSQCSWVDGAKQNIVAVPSLSESGSSNTSSGGGLGAGAIAGIAAGVFLVATMALVAGLFRFRRRQNQKRKAHDKLESSDNDTDAASSGQSRDGSRRENETIGFAPKCELDATPPDYYGDRCSVHKPPVSPSDESGLNGSTLMSTGSGGVSEADGTPRQIFEMPGDMPVRQEHDGRQLSEKEKMIVRELRYNGVDLYSNSPTTPISPPPPFSPTESHATLSSAHVSPLTPESQTRHFMNRGVSNSRTRRQFTSGDVIELSPFERDNVTMGLISPIVGPSGSTSGESTDGHSAFPFSPIEEQVARSASLAGIQDGSGNASIVSPVCGHSGRRRFSYE